MFPPTSSSVVGIGTVGAHLPPESARARDGYACKVGGAPAWLGAAPVGCSPSSPPACAVCGAQLLLVSQVYAPVETPRALYIFGCNRPECAKQNCSWRVFRCQTGRVPTPEPPGAEPISAEMRPPVPPASSSPLAAFDGVAACATNNEWTLEPDAGELDALSSACAANDEWTLEPDAGELDAQIEALLNQRDDVPIGASNGGSRDGAALLRNDVGTVGPSSRATTTDAIDASATPWDSPCFPSFLVEVVAEPDTGTSDAGVEDDDGDDDVDDAAAATEDDGDEGDSRGHEAVGDRRPRRGRGKRTGITDSAMLARVEAYLADGSEEDPKLCDLIRSSATTSGAACGGDGSPSHAGDDGGETYEQPPAHMRAMLRFQQRVRHCPSQVIRYAYGGEPLWSVAHPPVCRPPRCACGATRRFELQLMPATLFVLQVHQHALAELSSSMPASASPPPASPAGTASLPGQSSYPTQPHDEPGPESSRAEDAAPPPGVADSAAKAALDAGMEWGVLTVWSCPESCDESHEEVAIVQPAEDG